MPRDEGYNAYWNGYDLFQNPYASDENDHAEWAEGWLEAQESNEENTGDYYDSDWYWD